MVLQWMQQSHFGSGLGLVQVHQDQIQKDIP